MARVGTGAGPDDGFVVTPVDLDHYAGSPHPAPGARVAIPAGPPWLVVNHDLESVVVPEWPIRLWRVDGVEPAPGETTHGYTRAAAFTVIEELERWLVFGPRGHEVAAIVERARALSAEDARRLAGAIHPDVVAPIIDRAWQRYLAAALPLRRGGGGSLSPVGPGIALAQKGVEAAARRAGAAFVMDDDEGIDVLADPVWRAAHDAASAAVMARGTSNLFDEDDRERLEVAWRALG